jgi:hypothetical protein
MTLTDWILDIALIAVVLLQIRGRRLTARWLLAPIVIVAWAATTYLRTIPTSGNDLLLIIGCAAAGTVLGVLCAVFTSVTADGPGAPVAKAGAAAAALWVLGAGTRLAFQLYVTHGGGPAVARFSIAHSLTLSGAWTAALVLMALCEAVFRTGVLAWRGYAVRRQQLAGGAGRGPSLPVAGHHGAER